MSLKKKIDRLESVAGFLTNLGEELVEKVRDLDLIPLAQQKGDKIVHEAKKNLEGFVEKVQESDLYERAKVTAEQTKRQVLSILSIPSQSEVVRLSRKISALEKRVSHLKGKAA
ncbi:MAG: hypothetical protein Q7S98_05790 [Deltaproteobacteria bacterium]|nr:hypothetical protein [Deltaproteobacteria bacterium]